MRFRNIALAFLMLALAMPAFAQEQRASIEGVVKDATGAVMPGVTVEVKNEANGVVVSAVTDANGVYRFPSLASGIWDVTATLAGFNTASTPDVPLTLGQIKKVDFTLAVAGVAESVQVTAESPLVDVRQSARSTSIRNEQIDLLPRGRDFSTLVTQAPGANNESTKLGGLSIDGASAGENRFIIDGIETTNVCSGRAGQERDCRLRRRSPGEVVGLHGGVRRRDGRRHQRRDEERIEQHPRQRALQLDERQLESSNRPVLRRGVLDNSKAEYQTYPEDSYNRFEPGVALGGPIVRDKMWFFGAYQPALTTTTRTVDAQTSGNPNSSIWNDVESKQNVQYISANTTAQIGNNIRTRVSYNNSWTKTDGRLPAQAGTTSQLALLDLSTTDPNWSLSANLDWVATPSLYFGFRGGYYMSDTNDTGVPNEIRYLYSRGNVGQASVPASFQHAANFSNVFTNKSIEFDKQTRALLPDRRHVLRERGRPAHLQGRRAG